MKIRYISSTDPRSKDFNNLIQENFPKFFDEDDPDMILVSGGDGALLHAIQEYNHFQAPFMGRAAGTLNFMMNGFDNPIKTIKDLISEKIIPEIVKTTSICMSYKSSKDESFRKLGYAVNEVILGSNIMGFHYFKIHAPDQGFDLFDIKGTGISISTSLGSTGYNFNLGGPVIPLDSKYWIIKGIVTNKYLEDIINIDDIIIEIQEIREPTFVFKDGIKVKQTLKKGDQIKLNRGQTIKLAFFNIEDFRKRRLNIASRYRKE